MGAGLGAAPDGCHHQDGAAGHRQAPAAILVVLRCAARLLQLPPGIPPSAQQAPARVVPLDTHRQWQRCCWSSGAAGLFQLLPGFPLLAQHAPSLGFTAGHVQAPSALLGILKYAASLPAAARHAGHAT